MIRIEKMTSCTLDEAVQAWNEGFEGYYVNAATTPEAFLKRMVAEDLSPTLTLLALDDNQPVGIIMHGVRTVQGRKIAWNGGTGVAQSMRGKGVGRKLLSAALELLQEEGVETATLEALTVNESAIALYKRAGYGIVDQLEYLTLKGALPGYSYPIIQASGTYSAEAAFPVHAGQLPFYRMSHPWQTHWQSAKEGEAVILRSEQGEAAGYAYYRKAFNPEGEHISTTLYQCEALPDHPDSEYLIHRMLGHVFGNFEENINRIVPNLPQRASALAGAILKQIGFTVYAEQMQMSRQL
ncbi:GNAT family N-acetyltransferase [Paenibacillus sp. P96]|uniref:GNAT family N-acetyltransferase n=1 Tax=Paenibacillus zeirhizosphaerae TaxID=2987519 RepID=A0ABT9FRR7_9BACL|nr:GNAT family N-acetyltransferase [Paenibacillus sp. P96]MDP4097211.1 GNAT family N-acetyltransferase [Paenibacillus sp. P96]